MATRAKPAKPKRLSGHALIRIIIGNQLTIMRLLRHSVLPNHQPIIDQKVRWTKELWRHHFDEEVGFESGFGDTPCDN